MSAAPIDLVLSKFSGVKENGKGWKAECPLHEEYQPSLLIKLSDKAGEEDRVYVDCYTGCESEGILAAVGLTWKDLRRDDAEVWTPKGPAVAEYQYVDEQGRHLFTVCRTADKLFPCWRPDAGSKTGKRWKLGDTRRVLYHLPEVLRAVASGATIYIVEGEKDADALRAAGVTATCNPHGAGKWRSEYSKTLVGAAIIIVADKDVPGRAHAATVAASLSDVAASVCVVEAAEGKDAADHLATGHGLDDFVMVDADVSIPPSHTATVPPQPDEAPAPEGFELMPLDWQTLLRDGVPDIEYISEPYLPKLARIWVWGQTGSMKSLWCLHEAARLSREGVRVSYFSEENPIGEELRRLSKMVPSPDYFRMFHRTGMDLADDKWIVALLAATKGDDVAILDSWTDLWSGDEDSNRDMQKFDAGVLKPLQAQGVTPVVIHHMGHQQMFSDRGGATAGRGASSLGQKADVTLTFKSAGDDRFTIVYGKSRIGGTHHPPCSFKVEDTDDGRVEIAACESPEARVVAELVERAVQAVLTAPQGYLTTNELRAVTGGSRSHQKAAVELLADDERVGAGVEKVRTQDGRQRDSKVWRPAGPLGARLVFDEDGEPK